MIDFPLIILYLTNRLALAGERKLSQNCEPYRIIAAAFTEPFGGLLISTRKQVFRVKEPVDVSPVETGCNKNQKASLEIERSLSFWKIQNPKSKIRNRITFPCPFRPCRRAFRLRLFRPAHRQSLLRSSASIRQSKPHFAARNA